MMNSLVKEFCTPPLLPFTDADRKSLTGAERFEIEFEGRIIDAFSWGKGKTIILAHGWGSRASHMAFIARYLSGAGFRTITFDYPAHSSVRTEGIKEDSNMFEFCRALNTVVNKFDPVYAIIGHSLGAASAAFTVSGFAKLAHYKIEADKLILISCFLDGNSIIRNFCLHHEKGLSVFEELKGGLEKEFDFSADYYSVAEAMKLIKSDVLLIHDKDDDVFPINEAETIKSVNPNVTLFTTSGYGHYKILLNRNILKLIGDFLAKQ